MSAHTVLIFSTDPLAAALLGAAVELAGHRPSFPQPAEPARAALRRARPEVVLVDCDHDESCADAFIGPALMTGARAILFRSHRSHRSRTEVDDVAARLSIPVVDLPADVDRLVRLLEGLPEG